MKSLTLYVNARTQSERCKNKLLRPFLDTTLIDIALDKLQILQDSYPVIFAAHEESLLDKARSRSLPYYKRSYESSVAEDNLQEVFEVLDHIDTEFVAFMNPCCPCMTVQTITKAIDRFIQSDSISLSCVQKYREWMFFRDNSLVIDMTSISTKSCDYVWQVTHTLNMYPRERFYKDGILWKGEVNDPYLFEIDRVNAMDIDHEDEFYACEKMYSTINNISLKDNNDK